MICKPGEGYRALEDYDLLFPLKEVTDFIYLWQHGHSLENIWRFLKSKYSKARTFDEISLLLFDLSAKGKVEPRAQGIKEAVWADEQEGD
jgi:hypothetical protein